MAPRFRAQCAAVAAEHLRKAAKRGACERSPPLAEAQRARANNYGFATWEAYSVPRLLRERILGPEAYTLWEATPLDWAIFLGRPSARAALEKIERN